MATADPPPTQLRQGRPKRLPLPSGIKGRGVCVGGVDAAGCSSFPKNVICDHRRRRPRHAAMSSSSSSSPIPHSLDAILTRYDSVGSNHFYNQDQPFPCDACCTADPGV